MKIAYFDCASGISGDMTLGALVDLGIEVSALQAGIDSLGLPSCQLVTENVIRHGFRATNLTVQHEPEHAHRHLHHITEMIDGSVLTDCQKDLARRIFTRLGEAEAKVHGTTIRKVHFHEVGAVDSIADIVGTAIAVDLLGADRIVCSPIPTGTGHIQIAHGRVSVPAPATAELLRGVPLAESCVPAELTTPTGAAIVATLADEFGHIPAMSIESIGYGAGDRQLEQQPNILRVLVGQSVGQSGESSSREVCILETNLDDISGEIVAHCGTLLMEAGALDVYTTAIQMKKNRPAVKVTVLCGKQQQTQMEAILFRETGTLGIRRWTAGRTILEREQVEVDTQWGTVRGKTARLQDGVIRFSPEFESCRQIASANKVAVRDVFQAAIRAFPS